MPITYSCPVAGLHLSAWRFSNFFISRTPKSFIYFLRILEAITTNNEQNNRRAAYEQNAQVNYLCRHLPICLLNIWGSVSFVVLTTFSYNSGSQPVCRDPKVGGEQQTQQFAKSQIFRTAHINILYYISKSETQTDFCEVHIVTIIIPVWFLL